MEKTKVIDYIVLGAGPAGLQLGYFFEQGQQDYLILESKKQAASFFEKYPRTGNLISFNKVYNIYDDPEIELRWDWNSLLTHDYAFPFKNYSRKFYPKKEELVEYLRDFAEHYRLNIQYEAKITQIKKESDGRFCLVDGKGNRYWCRSLIVATGFSRERLPDIPGIELVEDTYGSVSLDPDEFKGQRVLIIGKGNSAFEIADNILETAAIIHLASPDTVRFAWNTRHPGHLRGHTTRILDAYQLKLLHSVLDCDIRQIEKEQDKYVVSVKYTHAQGEEEELLYDRVICCTGFRFDRSIFDDSCQPELAIGERLPDMTSAWESVNVSGLYFAGTLMQVRDFQRAGSAFIDGFRYNIRTLYHFLDQRYQGRGLPFRKYPVEAEAISQTLLKRVCRTSALWTQFGYLCDVLVIDEESGENRYYEELPVDYVLQDSIFSQKPHYYTVTFEWGPWEGDVFAIDRHPHHEQADASAFLHPIVRRYVGQKLVAEHHLLEDLFGMYSAAGAANVNRTRSGRPLAQYHVEEHEQPLCHFFEQQLKLNAKKLMEAKA